MSTPHLLTKPNGKHYLHFEHQPEGERAVLDNFRDGFADFWKNYEMKLYEFRVIPREPGSLRSGRKLKRVMDQREMDLPRVVGN
jgi:hypothetical protein